MAQRILIADASAEMRQELARIAREAGAVEVVEASGGTAAREALARQHCPIAFVDPALPDLGALDALATARPAGRTLLVLTAAAPGPALIEAARKAGAYDVLKKPFDPAEVAAVLAAQSRMQRSVATLIVEDSSATRTILARLAAQSRFQLALTEVDSGGYAVKLNRLRPQELAIVDVNLADINGLEVACQLQLAAPDIKVVLMSADGSAALPVAAQSFGAVAFLKKPFYPRDLDLVLHKVFDLRLPSLASDEAAQLRQSA